MNIEDYKIIEYPKESEYKAYNLYKDKYAILIESNEDEVRQFLIENYKDELIGVSNKISITTLCNLLKIVVECIFDEESYDKECKRIDKLNDKVNEKFKKDLFRYYQIPDDEKFNNVYKYIRNKKCGFEDTINMFEEILFGI